MAAISEVRSGHAGSIDKSRMNQSRWYDSSTGRWLSQDPIGFGGGDANLYGYVGNSPSIRTDPTGCILESLIAEAIKTALEAQHNGEASSVLTEQQEKAVDACVATYISNDINVRPDPDLVGARNMSLSGVIPIPTTKQEGGGPNNPALALAGSMGFDTDKMNKNIQDLQARNVTLADGTQVTILSYGQTATLSYKAYWDPSHAGSARHFGSSDCRTGLMQRAWPPVRCKG